MALVGFVTSSHVVKSKKLSRYTHCRKNICSNRSDGLLASTAIQLFRKAIQTETGRVATQKGYDGLVEDCRYLQNSRNPIEQREAVFRIISSLFVAPIGTQVFRSLLGIMPVTWAFHLMSEFTQLCFEWLVGPCQAHGVQNEPLKRGVFIPKCRFLEESNCKGMCVNLCKIPTQQFFNNTLGFPFSMEPNYETGSCQITFGKAPLPLDQDTAVQFKCSKNCCSRKDSITQKDKTVL